MNCQICTGAMDIFATYTCGHQLCMTCSARLVFLYMQPNCPLCRRPSKSVVFSSLLTTGKSSKRPWKGRKVPVDVFYEGDYAREKMEDLLSNKCQKCYAKLGTLMELKKHYTQHGLVLCFECIKNRKDFWNEIKLYRSDTIRDHKNGSLREEGFEGHVFCIHCKIYLFDSDDAKRHCNLKHELCHVCDMTGTKYQYYNGFKDLETHYKSAHYCCSFQTCQTNKCYVFPYQTELFEHLTRFHGVDIRLLEIPMAGKCNVPVMNPFKRRRQLPQVSVVDPSGREVRSQLPPGPNVSQRMDTSNTGSGLPGYLDRAILEEERRKQQRRRMAIDRICKGAADEVEEIVNGFLEGSMDVKEAFNKVSGTVGDALALKLFESGHFGPKQSVVEGSIKALRKEVMFPKFTSEEPTRYKEPEKKKNPGFRVIDLHQRKQ
ncbi:RING zinc finger domain-containing protein [Encephalitozoon intestinalis ATCC 50506]|uniref:RING zinc finger domain-containing protein n=1 Tax=Encephalitozoon intestinalis (strain ATCC 50506) TaxID=876142 RepID=E0S5E5_ENCIT|nr:RING zinc finger domain-containing protein [Encephalitozoon intestinalis ATCC 50506]ADM10930.1 RING zinc finger domain-containing protein [Encephalitozoon intestinalis ATCC 50506]UTX44564.1 hypothetical protein GPK93_01g00740 [Encephalitozoon intestinalis]